MATAKRLPSGSYRVRLYVGASAGKKTYKSFTAPTKKEAERLALEFENNSAEGLTFGQALDEYISIKERVLSPASIREYKRSRRANFRGFEDIPLENISQKDIQKHINDLAKNHSPKTCRDVHGLISAVFKMYRPDFYIQTTLPQKVNADLNLPTEEDIKRLLRYFDANNKPMADAVLLASLAPMRRSEICALMSEDINGNVIHVRRAMVYTSEKEWIIKTTKSVAGDRFVPLPQFVVDRFKGKEGRLVPLVPTTITNDFIKARNALGLPAIRFHDLRHYGASMLHALGVPDAYIMARGGWGSDAVLKQVYRHALDEESRAINDRANKAFSAMYDTKDDTK